MSVNGGIYYYLASMPSGTVGTATAYTDIGTAIPVPGTTAPDDSTAQGPLVKELRVVGSRLYGVRDTVNRYRIWYSSGSLPVGAFTGDDGGYLEWSPGGKYIPVHVEDYRDGKGTPLATVFCDSADG
jgi:hypothetical protein